MNYDRDLLILVIVGGILTFASYYYAYQSGKGMTLWGGVKPNERIYYTISGLLAGLVFLYQFYYYIFYRHKKSKEFKGLVYTAMILITFASALWVPLTFLGLTNSNYKYTSIFVLLLVSIGSILLVLATIIEKEDKKDKKSKKKTEWGLAVAAGIIFSFHVTYFDLLSWGPAYIQN